MRIFKCSLCTEENTGRGAGKSGEAKINLDYISFTVKRTNYIFPHFVKAAPLLARAFLV